MSARKSFHDVDEETWSRNQLSRGDEGSAIGWGWPRKGE